MWARKSHGSELVEGPEHCRAFIHRKPKRPSEKAAHWFFSEREGGRKMPLN